MPLITALKLNKTINKNKQKEKQLDPQLIQNVSDNNSATWLQTTSTIKTNTIIADSDHIIKLLLSLSVSISRL